MNYLEDQKDIPPLSTFYSHIKTMWFQLVILVSHNNQKGYSSKLFSSENSAQYKHGTKQLFRAASSTLLKGDVRAASTPYSTTEVFRLRLVDSLRNMLFIAVDDFPYSQKPSFCPRFYTRFIHMGLYFDFNRLAML